MDTIILEVREGVGGEEASLFAYELFNMYKAYSNKQGWKVEELDITPSKFKGIKTGTFEIKGEGAEILKHEAGVHRVQRVPATERQGRVHTSTATVAVLNEKESVKITINPNELDIRTCRASGAGGQHINKTESAIRIVHKPTGIVVECQNERSQQQNKQKALEILALRLQEYYQDQVNSNYAKERRDQLGNGDRSEKIRTYNFPQDRITDHRLNKNFSGISKILNGNLGKILQEF